MIELNLLILVLVLPHIGIYATFKGWKFNLIVIEDIFSVIKINDYVINLGMVNLKYNFVMFHMFLKTKFK